MTDTIIIGAGHNGLTCAAYLARAGRKVIVLEAAERVGGIDGICRQAFLSEPTGNQVELTEPL